MNLNFQWRPFLAGCLTGILLATFLVILLANGPWTATSVAGATAIIVLAHLGRSKNNSSATEAWTDAPGCVCDPKHGMKPACPVHGESGNPADKGET